MVELYKEGREMAIRTDAGSEPEFIEQFSELLNDLIASRYYEGIWDQQLRIWLPQFVEICCAFRGYKSDVDSRTVYVAGSRLLMVKTPPTHVSPDHRAEVLSAIST